jgi:hypothetical protein
MNATRISIIVLLLLFGVTAVSPILAKKDPPAVNDEGMYLVENSEFATAYADPGADLSIYNRIILLDATVEFKKDWKRHQNRSNPLKVKDRDMVKIQEDVAKTFREVFTKELVDAGYAMTLEPAEDVLLVKPAIVDLDVISPDIQDSTLTRSFSDSAGEMTLNLELFDSVTGDKITEATDRKRDMDRGYLERRTSVRNQADARRMMTKWAKALTATLDQARTSNRSVAD